MMKRYIVIPAVIIKKELYPIWDDRLEYNDDEDYGKSVKLKDTFDSQVYELSAGIFDLKTREISEGIILNYYPEKTEYQKGEKVVVEYGGTDKYISEVESVEFLEFDLQVMTGKKILKYYERKTLGYDGKIEPECVYALREWKETYNLTNGAQIDWKYKISRLIETPNLKK